MGEYQLHALGIWNFKFQIHKRPPSMVCHGAASLLRAPRGRFDEPCRLATVDARQAAGLAPVGRARIHKFVRRTRAARHAGWCFRLPDERPTCAALDFCSGKGVCERGAHIRKVPHEEGAV